MVLNPRAWAAMKHDGRKAWQIAISFKRQGCSVDTMAGGQDSTVPGCAVHLQDTSTVRDCLCAITVLHLVVPSSAATDEGPVKHRDIEVVLPLRCL